MTIALDDLWIWDAWYARDGEVWHAFFLQAPKSLGEPELRHWHTTVGHATSRNLRDWEHHGTCFAPRGEPAWDDHIWTGSVVRGDDGLWHMLYTGSSRAEDGLKQRIGRATSRDLHHWERAGPGPCLDIDPDRYEELRLGFWHDRAFRDPWVMRDPEGAGWLMSFTARVPNVVEPNGGGAIGFATSPDLAEWTLHDPVHSGGFGQLEVPQVIELEGRWFCLFCTAAAHFSKAQAEITPGGPVTGTHYLVGDGPRGPWRVAPGPFLDGGLPPRRYAARILEAEDGPVLLGFADRPDGVHFQGHVTDPDPVEVTAEGLLRVIREQAPWPTCP